MRVRLIERRMSNEIRNQKFEIRPSEPRGLSRRDPQRLRTVRRFAIFVVALVIFNLLCYHLLPAQIDLTHRRAFTLAPQPRNLLASLTTPVDVVVLAPKVPRT